MKVAIIGSGNVGTSIARGFRGLGHEVTVADVAPEGLEAISAKVDVTTTESSSEAVDGADFVVLAVPFGAVGDLASDLSDELDGKVVIDVTNPLKGDLSGLEVHGRSAAEIVQERAPKAKVVKAFNTVFASNQADPDVDGIQLDGFVAGDDADSKKKVAEVLEGIGYRPIDVGPLSAATYLEGMAFLNIALNATNGWSWQSGWKLVGPTN